MIGNATTWFRSRKTKRLVNCYGGMMRTFDGVKGKRTCTSTSKAALSTVTTILDLLSPLQEVLVVVLEGITNCKVYTLI